MILLKRFLDRINLADVLICSILLIFIAFLSGSYAAFFVVTLLLATFIFSLAVYHYKTERLDKKAFNYSAAVFSFISICTIAVVGRNLQNINFIGGIFLIMLGVALLCGGITFAIWFKTLNVKISKKLLLKCLPLVGVAFLILLLSLPLLKGVPLFDEWFYYENLFLDINVNTLNSADILKICGHMTQFWTIIVYVINCFIGNLYGAAILVNVLLLIISIPVVYKTVKIICPKCSYWFALLCIVMFAFSPFTFGFVGYVYSQTILVYSLLFFLCAYLSKNKVLIFITALMLIFTFETGIFITSILLFLPILLRLVNSIFSKNFITELKKHGLDVLNISLLLIHVVWIVIFLQRNWGGIGYEGNAAGGISFKFNEALYANLILFTNFNWIIYAGILAAFIKLLVNISKKKINTKSVIGNKSVMTFIGAFAIWLVFSTFIEMINYTRYILPIFVCSYFLFFASIYYLSKDIKIKKVSEAFKCGVLACLSILLVVQSYITIDPVMFSNPEKTYMGSGNNYLVNAGYRDITRQPFDPDITWYFFDPYVYNRQVANFSITFNKALSSINYNTDKCFIVSFDTSNQHIFENKYYGLGYAHIETKTRGFHGWDDTKKQQYIALDESKAIRYTVRKDTASIQSLLEEGEYTEYWFLDYNSRIEQSSIQYFVEENNNIKIEKYHDVAYMGWKFTLSKISLTT